MCFFIDLLQLQDFMQTLVKNAHVYSRLLSTKKKTPEKGGPGSLGSPSRYATENYAFQGRVK